MAIKTVSNARTAMLFIAGRSDQMTPPQAAQALISAAQQGSARVSVARLSGGHQIMTEAPDATLAALKEFLKS